jgi:hypothetical protein
VFGSEIQVGILTIVAGQCVACFPHTLPLGTRFHSFNSEKKKGRVRSAFPENMLHSLILEHKQHGSLKEKGFGTFPMNRFHREHIPSNALVIVERPQRSGKHGKARQALYQGDVVKFFLFILSICYIPAILIWTQILPFEYRFHSFIFVLVCFLFYCSRRRYSLHELGFRADNLGSSLRWNLLFCMLGGAGLCLTHKIGYSHSTNAPPLPHVYAIYIFFLGPVQEIIFRGILFAEMKRLQIFNKRWILLISTLSFCFLHIIYRHPPLLIITFISGLVWGIIYLKWRNIWGIALSHSILGALAIFLGVV